NVPSSTADVFWRDRLFGTGSSDHSDPAQQSAHDTIWTAHLRAETASLVVVHLEDVFDTQEVFARRYPRVIQGDPGEYLQTGNDGHIERRGAPHLRPIGNNCAGQPASRFLVPDLIGVALADSTCPKAILVDAVLVLADGGVFNAVFVTPHDFDVVDDLAVAIGKVVAVEVRHPRKAQVRR